MKNKIENGFDLQRVLSEKQIASKFVEDNKDKVLFCRDRGSWLTFEGSHWKPDPLFLDVRKILTRTVSEYFEQFELLVGLDEKLKIKFLKYQNKYFKSSSLKQILAVAEIISKIQIEQAEFDRKPTLLAAPNGTVDLSTGLLREARADDYITKIISTEYHPDEECPRFLKFMEEITSGDKELEKYLLKILGYCLTGLMIDQKVYFFYGSGANGKSVLLEVFRAVLGADLVIQVDSKTLVKNSRIIREDVARFNGARAATCSEISNCDTLDDSLIKSLSGGDRQVSRKLRENSVEFENQAKILTATNCLPALEGTDNGIARRTVVIPFTNEFKNSAEDPSLKDDLIGEREGILALLVQYAKDVINNGIGELPAAVGEATDHYINTSNSVKCYVMDWCIDDPEKEIAPRELFNAYREYCKRNTMKAVSMHDFPNLLKTMGFEQRKSGSKRLWQGITLKDNLDSNEKNPDNMSNSEVPLDLPSTSEELNDTDDSTAPETVSADNIELAE